MIPDASLPVIYGAMNETSVVAPPISATIKICSRAKSGIFAPIPCACSKRLNQAADFASDRRHVLFGKPAPCNISRRSSIMLSWQIDIVGIETATSAFSAKMISAMAGWSLCDEAKWAFADCNRYLKNSWIMQPIERIVRMLYWPESGS
ncbi:hypothetical protein PV11_05388 [Exophiala sideris]|uniref:Uncharacterized protein n=1 Tax=Exophiala sideris TaxID=1016849 RepID=A0A0D1W3I9_9EURO|nr:hypothetical protein PV11_05388 [Exophiala sideris]